jgi:signal transduction histidine kinase
VKVNPLRSVGARLSLALLLVVAGSLALVYLVVIPSLEGRLIDSKINQLRTAVKQQLLKKKTGTWYQDVGVTTTYFASDARDAINARVVVFHILSNVPSLRITVQQDSAGLGPENDIENDAIALRTAFSGNYETGTVQRGGTRYAEVAFLLPNFDVGLVSAPLKDTLGAVSVARQRLLIAGAIVLVLSLLVGYSAAWVFARRIRRLEQAAERIAGGEFDEPIVDHGQDEIGELARAFDRMRERLSQLDRARREFIANASHELRTPLFTLGGFLELLDDADMDDATREEFLTTMRDQVKRLSKLAAELLDLSRLDAGHIDLERVPVSLAATARLVADDFAAVARRSGHELRVEADESALAVGDEQRIVQVIRNLVENAFMHTPPGTTVRLRAVRLPAGAVLSVEDDGPGIPHEQRAHVFERFYRGDGSRASGSGLGLAIALELARAMGGTLEVDSRPGRTVFTLKLPASDVLRGGPMPEPVELGA